MIFYVQKAMIEEAKELSYEQFWSKYDIHDVCNLMGLPINTPQAVYKYLHRALVRNLSNWEECSIKTTTKGNQPKFYSATEKAFIKLRFRYEGVLWHDELVEVFASDMFCDKFSTPVVKQLPVLTDKGWGVYSEDFAQDATFIPFYTLLETSSAVYPVKKPEKRFDFIKDLMSEITGLDVTDYLVTMMLTDTIVLNEDRHLNNLGVMYDDGKYTIAPIFDYGLGMFEGDPKYDRFKRNGNLTYALNSVKSIPFFSKPFANIKGLCRLGYSDILSNYIDKLDIPDDSLFPNSLSAKYVTTVLDKLRSIVYVQD